MRECDHAITLNGIEYSLCNQYGVDCPYCEIEKLNARIAELETHNKILSEKEIAQWQRNQVLEKCIAELEAGRRWRTDLPVNIDECMDIAVKLKVGWFRCIGYVLLDLEITDYDQNHVGYTWGEGCYWRHVSDPPENE